MAPRNYTVADKTTCIPGSDLSCLWAYDDMNRSCPNMDHSFGKTQFKREISISFSTTIRLAFIATRKNILHVFHKVSDNAGSEYLHKAWGLGFGRKLTTTSMCNFLHRSSGPSSTSVNGQQYARRRCTSCHHYGRCMHHQNDKPLVSDGSSMYARIPGFGGWYLTQTDY